MKYQSIPQMCAVSNTEINVHCEPQTMSTMQQKRMVLAVRAALGAISWRTIIPTMSVKARRFCCSSGMSIFERRRQGISWVCEWYICTWTVHARLLSSTHPLRVGGTSKKTSKDSNNCLYYSLVFSWGPREDSLKPPPRGQRS